MKLIREHIHSSDLEVITETVEVDGEKKREHYLRGVYLEADTKNRNGRVYPKTILEREVQSYNTNKIATKTAWGQLDHPDTTVVQLKHVSHLMTELFMNGNQGIGKAKIVDSVDGRTLKACLDAGGVIGMSTRGVGDVINGIVGETFMLICIDAVADPSAPNAYVEGILESKEFIIGNDGEIVERAVATLQKRVDEKYDRFGVSKHALTYMNEFINAIRKKHI